MIKSLQAFFERHLGSEPRGPEASERRLQLATAALFVEMTRADFEVSPVERQRLRQEVRAALDLSVEETQELVEVAEREAAAAVELFQFTRLVDSQFSPEAKVDLVERLWRLAFADDRIDRNEEHVLRKIANLLHVPHREFIAAKQRARSSARPTAT